jgi:CRP/FNR family transcriptional regulator, cyclic AMP receptor protein
MLSGVAMKPTTKQAFDPQIFLKKIGPGKKIRQYRKREAIFAQGEPADSLFYIQTGRVKLTVTSAEGKEATIALLQADDFFGEGSIAGQSHRIASAVALSDCTILKIERDQMIRVLHKEHGLSDMFIKYLLSRNIRYEEDLIDQLFNSSEKRLARILLLLSRYGKEPQSEPIIPKISQETLAEMVGTTRSRINFFMNKFRKLGFIDYDGGLEIKNSLLNVVLHD